MGKYHQHHHKITDMYLWGIYVLGCRDKLESFGLINACFSPTHKQIEVRDFKSKNLLRNTA